MYCAVKCIPVTGVSTVQCSRAQDSRQQGLELVLVTMSTAEAVY